MPTSGYSSTPPAIDTSSVDGDANHVPPIFPIGPFTKHAANPVLTPNPAYEFESAHLYNATAIVIDGRVFLLYRAQNAAKVSVVGLAWSDDGVNFTRLDRPILTPTEDWEEGGGVEDPRAVRINGTVYMTYTAYDLDKARLCLATSTDLINWKKYPPLYPGWDELEVTVSGRHGIRRDWTKAASIFTEPNAEGRYEMLWGESCIYSAESDDLIHWKTRPFDEYFATGVHLWENRLLEAGPAPVKTKDGKWIFFYNSATTGGGKYKPNQYSIGQMLVDRNNLDKGPVARAEQPTLAVDQSNEEVGQVNQVVFCEGIVQFKGQWLLYFGQGDSELGVAVAPAV
ncbi:Glycosyl hydrolases family 32 N-terminal domain [Geosmithia morbida]|uniref:Glycosyl hydrolases family 32 N-terminal domain n=1 Tax=Geosmithia morbida TaxID=1094350 RepID=A0A9P4YSU3_9HYPO|nr:Glycosyl hydrolases family 32 N-terminal domain [Geosmithia morbida]KAF4122145.1 Glycosyl hydrolases family 32 N-terminal domain [Geosmithia morbida]